MWRKSFALYTDSAAHFALGDVAHLREVVSVEGITRSGLVPNKAGMAVPSPRSRIFAGLDTSADSRLTIRLALACTTGCLSVARDHHVMLTGNFGRFGQQRRRAHGAWPQDRNWTPGRLRLHCAQGPWPLKAAGSVENGGV
jgi:hypothetical protein